MHDLVQAFIPFFDRLLDLAYFGHNVWVFDNHPMTLAAGCRNADVVLVDSNATALLPQGWPNIAAQVMRGRERLLDNGRVAQVPIWFYDHKEGSFRGMYNITPGHPCDGFQGSVAEWLAAGWEYNGSGTLGRLSREPQAPLPGTASGKDPDANSSPITLLPGAIAAIRRAAEANRVNSKFWLRLEVHLPGGPETLRHRLDIELAPPRPQDREFQSGGLPVVMLADQVEMLRGCTVDHGEKDGEVGFKIKNPHFEGDEARRWLRELERRRGG